MTELQQRSSDVVEVDEQGHVTDVVPYGMTNSEVEAFLAGAHVQESDDSPDAVERAIVMQVLNARTVDEVLADIEVVGLRNRVGETLTVEQVEWRHSEYEEGAPFYAIVHGVRDESGERETWSTGAKKVMAQLMRLQQLGELPITVTVRSASKPTKSGFYPYRLVRAS